MPANFDMPLEAMGSYKGVNPRPADFDAYWERALGELDEWDADIELTTAEFLAPNLRCLHLRFTGIGGSRVYAKLVLPAKGAAPVPAVLRFHGYSGNSGDWFGLLPYAAMGWAVAALDCRGQGGLSEDRGVVGGMTWTGHIVRGLDAGPDQLYYRGVYLDAVRLARIVMALDEVDDERVFVVGESQGGALGLACAALEPRIAKAAVQCPFLCDFKRVWQLDLLKDAYDELFYYLRRFDPRHERIDEIWTRLGYIDIQHLAPRVQGEVLMVVGLMDTVCPPSTQFAAYNSIASAKSMLLYPEFKHEAYFGANDIILDFLRSGSPAKIQSQEAAAGHCDFSPP